MAIFHILILKTSGHHSGIAAMQRFMKTILCMAPGNMMRGLVAVCDHMDWSRCFRWHNIVIVSLAYRRNKRCPVGNQDYKKLPAGLSDPILSVMKLEYINECFSMIGKTNKSTL